MDNYYFGFIQYIYPTGGSSLLEENRANLYQNLSVVIRIPLLYVLAIFRITVSRRHGDHIGLLRRFADIVALCG